MLQILFMLSSSSLLLNIGDLGVTNSVYGVIVIVAVNSVYAVIIFIAA